MAEEPLAESEEQTSEPETDAAAEAESEEQTSEPANPSAGDEFVALGPIECRLSRVPLADVLDLLSEESLRRVDATLGSASSEAQRKRMLATDGRATPVIFEAGETPFILHGYDELAAATAAGVDSVCVIFVPAGEGANAQSHIVEMLQRQRSPNQTSDDDELFYRVHASE